LKIWESSTIMCISTIVRPLQIQKEPVHLPTFSKIQPSYFQADHTTNTLLAWRTYRSPFSQVKFEVDGANLCRWERSRDDGDLLIAELS